MQDSLNQAKSILFRLGFCILVCFLVGWSCNIQLECREDRDCPKERRFCVAADCKQCTRDQECEAPLLCNMVALRCESAN